MAPTLASPEVQIGSMGIFWALIEPILAALPASRICEIGVAGGAFTVRLLSWGREHGCAYVGIDPEPTSAAIDLIHEAEREGYGEMLQSHSLAVLPTLVRCDVYFLDGDHNFHTVRNELTLIAGAACKAEDNRPTPIIFVHDVGWPWGRRDMYHLPSTVPVDARQAWSETLGVSLEQDKLVEGGLREPGRYAISTSAHGPRNGVLTAVEDFLAAPEGANWLSIILPVAYGLAILYQPEDASLTTSCREQLQALQKAAVTTTQFLQACEKNFLQLYLRGEFIQHLAATTAQDLEKERAAHYATLAAYADLERVYGELSAHTQALAGEYDKLLQAYRTLLHQQGIPVMVGGTTVMVHTPQN